MTEQSGSLLTALKMISRKVDQHTAEEKIRLLNGLSKSSFHYSNFIIQYHDLLLFMLAYPENKTIHRLAEIELSRLASVVEKLVQQNSFNYKLSATGIHATEQNVVLSLDMVRWLLENDENDIRGFFAESDETEATEIFQTLLKPVEILQTKEEEKSTEEWCTLLSGAKGKEAFRQLIALADASEANDSLRDILYNRLKIYITAKLLSAVSSRTFNRSEFQHIYYHPKLLKQFDLNKVWNEPLPEEEILSSGQKNHLVASSRWILSNISRETDPSTYAEVEATKYFELERGYGMVLFTMKPSRRLPLESYIGYLAYKNGLPIAYGGGWLFFNRCKLGINLLDAYRGGEATYLFAQLIRVYRRYYKAEHFIIEPYQFGKNNAEGLKSGAFWFYYRLGFRFKNEEMNQIAAEEFTKIHRNKAHKTTRAVLKSFTKEDLHLKLNSQAVEADPNRLSELVTQFIGEAFRGNRKKAYDDCFKGFFSADYSEEKLQNAVSLSVLQQWSVMLTAVSFSFKSKSEKRVFLKMLRSKTEGDERDYVLQLQKQRNLARQFSNKIGNTI